MLEAKRYPMTVEDAVAILEAMGCGSDPVTVLNRGANFRLGEEVELSHLGEFQFLLSPHTAKSGAHQIPARRVRLRFYADRGDAEGTLQDLVIFRLRTYRGLDRIIKPPNLQSDGRRAFAEAK